MDDLWYRLESLVPWVSGIDRMSLMLGALGFVVLVFWLISRKGSQGGGGSGGGGRRALNAAYKKIERAEIKQWQRPYALLATREPWSELPQYFLMELTSRLMDKDNVIEFILLAEKHKLERHQIPKIAQNDAGTALRTLSEELAAFAGRLRPREAETAYNLAIMIDPSNARAMYGLAKGCYASKRYGEAISLFEQAIPLCEAVLDTAKRLDVRSLRRDGDAGPEDMETIFEKAQEMYNDCLDRV